MTPKSWICPQCNTVRTGGCLQSVPRTAAVHEGQVTPPHPFAIVWSQLMRHVMLTSCGHGYKDHCCRPYESKPVVELPPVDVTPGVPARRKRKAGR